MRTAKPWEPAVLSGIVPGAGQFVNKQYGKALAFFAVLILAISLEISTGHYPVGSDGFTFRGNGGFFLKGIWGLITLGTQAREVTLVGLSEGDDSIVLLANGILAVVSVVLVLAVWVVGARDAFRVAAFRHNGGEVESSGAYFHRIWTAAYAYVILAPTGVLILLVTIVPIVFGIAIAFTNYDRNHLPPSTLVRWVGLTNFRQLVGAGIWAKTFVGVFGWTIVWAILATATTYMLGFLQAVILNSRHVIFPKVWRSILILPWAVPAMVSALVFRSLFNGQFGPISQFLVDIGLTAQRIDWLADPRNPTLARLILILVNLWLGFPFFMALIGSALTSIEANLYEAAKIDGANALQLFRHITFPIVFKLTGPLVILAFTANFNNFGVIYFLTKGGPVNPDYQFAGSTDLLVTWLFKLTLDNRLYDIGAVMSIVIFLVVGTFSLWGLRRSRLLEEN